MPLLAHKHGLFKSIAVELTANAKAARLQWSPSWRSIELNRSFTSQSRQSTSNDGGHRAAVSQSRSTRKLDGREKDTKREHTGLSYDDVTFTDSLSSPLRARQQSKNTRVATDVQAYEPIETRVDNPASSVRNDIDHDPDAEAGSADVDDMLGYEEERSQESKERIASRATTYKQRLRLDNHDMLSLVERKSSPRALRKLLQPSPSLHLEQALLGACDPKVLPRARPNSVHDLSYRNAKTLKIFNVNGYRHTETDDSISLQSVTAKCIRDLITLRSQLGGIHQLSSLPSEFDRVQNAGFSALSHAETQLLHAAGYNERDARIWAEILLEPNISLAARRLFVPGSGHEHHEMATPWFVMNFLLRRELVTAEALKLLLDYAWRALVRHEQDKSSVSQPPSPRMIMTVCVRLVRHSRDVWPQALPSITKLFSTFTLDAWTKYYTRIDKPMTPSLLQQLTFKSNRMLSQLSLAGRTHPVLSAVHQQRAQFDLIRKMTLHNPALPINREGHRALTKTLLLLKKSQQERDWALLQARSWPPFKVSKTRLDDPKDREYGTSTAGKSIQFMQRYGYPTLNWDIMAQVYTGWNPDGSPAIQQRAFMPAVPTSKAGEPDIEDVYAAIISSTRTLPEAWAAFLKFDSSGARVRAIYIAMFKKLLAQRPAGTARPSTLVHPDNEPATAGDAIEIIPPPSSPLEAIYLPSEPPSPDALLDTLLDRGFPIWGGLMCLLVAKAPDLEFALKVWAAGKYLRLDANGGAIWSTDHLLLLRSNVQYGLKTLPDLPSDLVTALVSCITSKPALIPELCLIAQWTDVAVGGWKLRRTHALAIVTQLLTYYKPRHSAPWNHLLEALTRREMFRDALPRGYFSRVAFWPLIAWAMSGNVLRSMIASHAVPDHKTFQYLSDITWEAAVATKLHCLDIEETRLLGVDGQPNVDREIEEAQLLMASGSSLLRRRFAVLVGLDQHRHPLESGTSLANGASMPKHLAIPKAVVLHKYVRALGILGDHEGIYSLVQWMADAASDLQELQDTQLNGSKQMRRLIIALRVWLECPSRDFRLAEREVQIQPAAEKLIQLVRQEVDQVRKWGGWPSDRDVDKYCSRHENYYQ